jgi:hypothetical protein
MLLMLSMPPATTTWLSPAAAGTPRAITGNIHQEACQLSVMLADWWGILV